jgi:hypothetical protein
VSLNLSGKPTPWVSSPLVPFAPIDGFAHVLSCCFAGREEVRKIWGRKMK